MNMKTKLRLFVPFLVLAVTAISPVVTSAQDAVSLTLWTFVNTHARWFSEQAERYATEVNPGFRLEVVEIAYSDMHDRLLIALQSGGVGAPDIADIEQGRFGGFLRSAEVGLVDLRPRLEAGGYLDQLVAAREALYSYGGAIYGIEHALTPVVLYYRADLWEAAGVDMNEIETWDEYFEAAQKVMDAAPGSYALPVFQAMHEMLLRQRGSDWFDEEGNVTIDSELSIDTMNWMLDQIDAGLAAQTPGSGTGTVDFAAIQEGRYIAYPGADWFGGFFKDLAPDMAGQWKAAPLPRWEEGGRRTSVWGGTGATIVDTSPHVEEAWKFLEFAMLSVEGNVRRYEMTTLFPPFIPAMSDPRLLVEDPYFSNQKLGELFAAIATDAPPQYQSPYRALLVELYSAAYQDIVDRVRTPEEVFTDIANRVRAEMGM